MKKQYYIASEDFVKMIDLEHYSTAKRVTPLTHGNPSKGPAEVKRKISTAVPSSIRVSEEKDKYAFSEDFIKMIDLERYSLAKKTAQKSTATVSKSVPETSGKLVLMPKKIPSRKKLFAPKSMALTKKLQQQVNYTI